MIAKGFTGEPYSMFFHVWPWIGLGAGDLLHAQDLQLDHPHFCARYDSDLAQATATRIRILNGLYESGLYLAGAHCYDHFIKLVR